MGHKKSIVEGHRRALLIVYNPEAGYSVSQEKRCGCIISGKKAQFSVGVRSAC